MKDKKFIFIIALSVVLIIALAYFASNKRKDINWEPTFLNTGTEPYDTYVTYHLLGEIFDRKKITSTRKPIYTNVKEVVGQYFMYPGEYGYDDEAASNKISQLGYDPMDIFFEVENYKDTISYLFVNPTFEMDAVDLDYLLDFVGLGNNLFISSERFPSSLMDTLQIKVNGQYNKTEDTTFTLIDYDSRSYNFRAVYSSTSLILDSCKLPIRALASNENKKCVFAEIKFGRGSIFLHTVPNAFTNINVLDKEKTDFAFRCLSYLPYSNNILWDEYQKQGLVGELSMFRVMLNSKPLRWALYLSLLGGLIYMLFGSKRIQRIIPIIKSPENSSVEFLNTISNLYYKKKDFKGIAEKRYIYLADFVRKNYYLSIEKVTTEYLDILHAKSGMDKEKLMRLFKVYQLIMKKDIIPNYLFLEYSNLLEEFYRKAKRK